MLGRKRNKKEATAGFEPAMGVLQTPALPLGYVALPGKDGTSRGLDCQTESGRKVLIGCPVSADSMAANMSAAFQVVWAPVLTQLRPQPTMPT